ncbi:MAG TPA: acetyl-CoA carboxylase biotin carboxylase subunit [Thermoanaerobaculia bacterium]|nr:acetyl-CoA carboxylase biotin carboxylase subunit [Thermoanaerobaculia bacterium]
MFKKILIANRGEIALRIISACRELDIKTVAIYSEADRDALHVRYADEDVCVGPYPSAASYLNISAIVSAAEITEADAIHPGYGFLSENAYFAEILQDCHIAFIGPSPDAMRRMGDKSLARRTVAAAGVPTVPGSPGPLESVDDAVAFARKAGYPVILKAAAGGGGRGMRVARDERELSNAYETARAEAEKAFANSDVYLEKYLDAPRHIEFQIFGDTQGNVQHLGERECSIQRRHQKLIEEAPSSVLTPDLRRRMGAAAVTAAKAVNYTNAGTIEFLLDAQDRFYFMEMNTRLQVEHPVTEEVTGVDMVKEQIAVAAGVPLSFAGRELVPRGHAIEFRVNAEDPVTFAPSPGRLTAFHPPGGMGVRVDTAAYQGYVIPPHYDSLIAKLIVSGRDREEAISRARRALDLFVIEGIKTSIPMHRRILDDPDFREGRLSTRFMERFAAAS